MVSIFIVLLVLCLLIGLPIFLALVIPSTIILTEFLNLPAVIVAQRFVAGMNSYTLLCVPFFMFAANVMAQGTIGQKLLKFSRTIVGHFYGGIAQTAIFACSIVAAISGAGTAGILTIGPFIVKEMEKQGYGKSFATGLVTSISVVAMLIPPSIIFIIYAMISGQSIAKLFLGGIGAGLVLVACFMVYSYFYARHNKLPLLPRATIGELGASFVESLWALGLPVVILGGIYSGAFSPTEAAGVAAVYTVFVEMFIYKDVDFKELITIAVKTGRTVAMIYILLGAGSLLSFAMTVSRVPLLVEGLIGGATPFIFLMIVNIAFLVAGMFVGPGSAIVILIPILGPMASTFGIDPIHLGVVVVCNVSIGMFTPPFGLDLFVACSVFKVGFSFISKAVLPFILLSLVVLLIVTYVPQISLWLPGLLM